MWVIDQAQGKDGWILAKFVFSAECTIGMVRGVDAAKALWRYGTMALWRYGNKV